MHICRLAYVNPWTGTPLRIIIPFGLAKCVRRLPFPSRYSDSLFTLTSA